MSRGWYDPQKDGDFDFARAYSDRGNYTDMRNVMRQWRGTDLLAAKSFKLDAPLPFSFKPHRDMRLLDLFRVLRDHYEGTKHDASDHYTQRFAQQRQEPHHLYRVHAVRLRRPAARLAARRDRPRGLDRLPPPRQQRLFPVVRLHGHGSRTAPAAKTPMRHGKTISPPCRPRRSRTPSLSFNTYARLSDVVDRQYRDRIEKTQKVWRNFEDFLFGDLEGPRERNSPICLKNNQALARKIIDNYMHGLEYRKWFLASELLREFR